MEEGIFVPTLKKWDFSLLMSLLLPLALESSIPYLLTNQGLVSTRALQHFSHLIGYVLTINEPVDYTARAVMILMRGKDIMRPIM